MHPVPSVAASDPAPVPASLAPLFPASLRSATLLPASLDPPPLLPLLDPPLLDPPLPLPASRDPPLLLPAPLDPPPLPLLDPPPFFPLVEASGPYACAGPQATRRSTKPSAGHDGGRFRREEFIAIPIQELRECSSDKGSQERGLRGGIRVIETRGRPHAPHDSLMHSSPS